MWLKRKVIEVLLYQGISRFILIGENVLNFHAGDREYYSEWYEEVENGFIALVSFRDFVEFEFIKSHIDGYLHLGGTLNLENWRTLKPVDFCVLVNSLVIRRIG
jgi:hypothetical protein